jgi:GT2 family glycosyltransferase
MTKVSVIIVNYFSGILTKACIHSIRRAKPSVPYEIFVFDNASHDDSREILEQDLQDVKTQYSSENLGLAKAVNRSIKETSGEYILLLNPDIVALEGAVEALIHFMDTHPSAGVVAGQLLNPNGTVQESAFRFYTPFTVLYRRTMLGALPFAKSHLDTVFMRDVDLTKPTRVDWVLGACMCVRRAAIENVGLMDERFFLYFEDMDWCRRFWENGWEVWCEPRAQFAHYHKRESARDRGVLALFNRTARAHIASGVKYFCKYRGIRAPKKDD